MLNSSFHSDSKNACHFEVNLSLTNLNQSIAQNHLSESKRIALLERIKSEPLNPDQLVAIAHTDNPMLVLAGAGSGKTRVITTRIAYLIACGVQARRILALTFTNKATQEMQVRVQELLKGETFAKPKISTLHALGLDIIRKHADQLGYSNSSSIVSDVEREDFLELGMRKLDQETIKELGRDPLQGLGRIISDYKNKLLSARVVDDQFAPAYKEYQSQMQKMNVLDFDDLIRLPCGIFSNLSFSEEIIKTWQAKYDYILVDEYQDTNLAQDRLLEHIAGSHGNLFVVGDDDQSIYSWRGANVELIRNFNQRWNSANLVKLETNYRSTQGILNLANKLMSNDSSRQIKNLTANRTDKTQPTLSIFESEFDEAKYIADTILNIRDTDKSIAIIIRNQYRMPVICDALEQQNIIYELWTNDLIRLADDKRDIQALFQCIDNPNRSDMALIRLLRNRRFEIKEKDFDQILEHWQNHSKSLWQALPEIKKNLPASCNSSIIKVQRLISKYNKNLQNRVNHNQSISEVTRSACLEFFPEIKLPNLDETQSKESLSGHTTAAWLARQLNYISAFEAKTIKPNLSKFLGHQERIRRKAKDPLNKSKKISSLEAKPVIISTIHAVKGLEFDAVFMPCMVEGVLPSKQALLKDNPEQLAEERRLAYVAITRAKSELRISYSLTRKNRSKNIPQTPSRYLEESGAILLKSESDPIAKAARQGLLF